MHVDVVGLPTPHIDLQETIGRGGFAVVYRALDTKLNRLVAVKILTGVVDQTELAHFEQECRMHGPLSNHPDIVTVFDAGYTDTGSPYLIMEYLEGGTIADRIATTGPIPWTQAISWVLPICDATQAAHDRGVLHRDIKPSNILLGPGGAKLADFGIACGRDATSPLFAVSWLHAAPESHSNGRDERSDVYSLGSTLYELLTGQAPFASDGQSVAALMHRLLTEAPQPIPSHLAPAWLSQVVQRCLSKDPAQRPQSAAELRAALANGPSLANGSVPTRAGQPVGPIAFAGGQADLRTALGTVAAVGNSPTTAMPVVGTRAMPALNSTSSRTVGGPAEPVLPGDRFQAETPIAVPRPRRGRARRRRSAAAAIAVLVLATLTVGIGLNPAVGLFDDSRGQATTGLAPAPETGADEALVPPTTTAVDPTSTVALPSSSSTETTATTTPSTTSSSSTSSSSTTAPSNDLTVPEVVGSSEHEATTELTDLGFTEVSVLDQSSDTVPAGQVIAIDPGEGSSVAPDTPIELTVSDGPATVEVPDLVGRTRPEAVAALEDSGLTATITTVVVEEGSPQAGVVIAQDLAAGSSADVGSAVTITVGRVPLVLTGGGIATAPPVVELPQNTFGS